MKIKYLIGFCLLMVLAVSCSQPTSQAWIRINQLGYLPNDLKVAVLAAKTDLECRQFELVDAKTNRVVWQGQNPQSYGGYGPFMATFRLDFSAVKTEGRYFLRADRVKSPKFRISSHAYDGSADFLLRYMRQQRCGFNPFLQDSCHVHDGFTVYGPMPDGTHIDVTGGWHDAGDYLQYSATSANATFDLLFAYAQHPAAFRDSCDAAGLSGANGIPDVLDEARWGLQWLQKMHPRPDWMFNQIADDRDHSGWRLPNADTTRYDKGNLERPVYFCSGDIQGLKKYLNRATGTASTAGKFAAAFALGAQLFEETDPDFAQDLQQRAKTAFQFGLKKSGACQTAPCTAPYFYEEDNWVDDMELGAAELFLLTKMNNYREAALGFAAQEPVTPWMGADTARHYQWYPFLNAGHFELAQVLPENERADLIDYYRQGVDLVRQRGEDNAFLMGVPFIWCSNNLVTAMSKQCRLYRELSGDSTALEMETALRDWLFGCNPWGTSMVVGLPRAGETPDDVHSAFSSLHDYPVDGGLIDGPVYGSIYKSLKYLSLNEPDEFAEFQSDLVVYHDDVGDYATNEPTMDGTAGLVPVLAALEQQGKAFRTEKFSWQQGAIVRGDISKKQLALVFTGDEFADGGEVILETLSRQQVPGSFFLTGKFYRNLDFQPLIDALKKDGHYLGPHSNQHLLYAPWENRKTLLVTESEFKKDLAENYAAMAAHGISRDSARYFLPPYEWYNEQIAAWTRELGLTLVNYSAGTLSHADYTVPSMGNGYRSSAEIMHSILDYEKNETAGLNGFILLSHIGSHPEREDKFYRHLDELITTLKARGYTFVRIDTLLK